MQNSNILDRAVSFYRSVSDTKPQTKTLKELLLTEAFQRIAERIRECNTDEQRKELKQKAPCFTVSGIFGDGTDGSIQKHSGLICVDIDRKDNLTVSNFGSLKELISELPCVAYCGASVSGSSFFVIVPIANPELHRLHFLSLQRAFKRSGIVIDKSGVNEARKRFVSFDPDPYINPKAETFKRYVKAEERVKPKAKESKEVNPEAVEELNQLANLSMSQKIDITGDYHQWFTIACALANSLDEDGRDLFHNFSCSYIEYDPDETDTKYDRAIEAVKVKGKEHPGIETVFYYCRQAGLNAIEDFTN